jgi:hypothetical protein
MAEIQTRYLQNGSEIVRSLLIESHAIKTLKQKRRQTAFKLINIITCVTPLKTVAYLTTMNAAVDAVSLYSCYFTTWNRVME